MASGAALPFAFSGSYKSYLVSLTHRMKMVCFDYPRTSRTGYPPLYRAVTTGWASTQVEEEEEDVTLSFIPC